MLFFPKSLKLLKTLNIDLSPCGSPATPQFDLWLIVFDILLAPVPGVLTEEAVVVLKGRRNIYSQQRTGDRAVGLKPFISISPSTCSRYHRSKITGGNQVVVVANRRFGQSWWCSVNSHGSFQNSCWANWLDFCQTQLEERQHLPPRNSASTYNNKQYVCLLHWH